MIFIELTLEDGVVKAVAQGHATEIISAFHHVASVALTGQGPWRITYVHGYFESIVPGVPRAPTPTQLDSDMRWELRAERKAELDARGIRS